jgi:predicted dehydrogenase
MSISQPLGVAVAGLGFGEAVHLPALRACGGHRTGGPLASAGRAPGGRPASQAGLPGQQRFRQPSSTIPAVEALVIATPPAPRFELAQRALLAGKHLLLEKPVGLNAAQAESLQRLALQRGLAVAVDFEYRAVPLFQQLEALLRSAGRSGSWCW